MSGKVVVNRWMSLDGFIAGSSGTIEWGRGRSAADYIDVADIREVASATGAMLVGRGTWDIGDKIEAEEPGRIDYPFSGRTFLLSHRPLDPPDPDVTLLSGDIRAAVRTALWAAEGRDLEVLGADVAKQCLQNGLVDEILVYVLPRLLGGGTRFEAPRLDLEPISTKRSGLATMLRFRVRTSAGKQSR